MPVHASNEKPMPETQKSNTAPNKQPLFTVSNEPPPGFEFLNQPQMTFADIYYAGNMLDEPITVRFTQTKVKILDPTKLVNMLPGVVNKKTVTQALTGDLDSHAILVCHEKIDASCGRLNPEVAGVIFDSNKYRLYVFINQRYLEKPKPPELYIAPPKIGFSASNHIMGVASGTLGQNNNNSYNVTNQLITAYNNMRMNLNSAFIYNQTQANLPGTTNLQITDWYFTYTKQRYQYQAGLLQTVGSIFLSNQNILGVAAGTTLETLANPGQSYGIPLTVFLPFPSRISIYRDNRLLLSSFYEAGNQIIDTSTLPTGAYDIQLVITDSQGVTRTETRFYLKSTMIPPLGQPQYGVAVGTLQAKTLTPNQLLPRYTSIPILQLWKNKRMAQNWGYTTSLTGSSNKGFLEGGVFILGKYYQLIPGIIAGTRGDLGASITNTWTYNRFSLGLGATQLFIRSNDPNPRIINSNETFFDPLTIPRTRANLTLGYSWNDTSVSLLNSLTKNDNLPTQYGVGGTFRTIFYRNRNFSTNFEFNSTKSQDGYLVYGQINLAFNNAPWTANSSLGYRQTKALGLQQNEPYGSASIGWSRYNASQEGWDILGNVNRDSTNTSYGTNIQRSGSFYKANLNVRRNQQSNNASNTQYTALFETTLAYAGKSLAPGYSNAAHGTGVAVLVKSDEKAGKFDIYVNNQQVKTVNVNQTAVIFLTPYRTYKISIRTNENTGFFKYDERPRKITLYKGNIAKLEWEANQQTVIYGTVVFPDGKPVANALLKGTSEYSSTDEQGQILVEVSENQHQLILEPAEGLPCRVDLLKIKPENGFAMAGQLVCKPTKESTN